jgi:hypothetical protein
MLKASSKAPAAASRAPASAVAKPIAAWAASAGVGEPHGPVPRRAAAAGGALARRRRWSVGACGGRRASASPAAAGAAAARRGAPPLQRAPRRVRSPGSAGGSRRPSPCLPPPSPWPALLVASPALASVDFSNLRSGATVSSPVHVEMAVKGKTVKPASARAWGGGGGCGPGPRPSHLWLPLSHPARSRPPPQANITAPRPFPRRGRRPGHRPLPRRRRPRGLRRAPRRRGDPL